MGHPNHLKWDFGAKSGKKRFLTRKYKNNKFSRFLRKFIKTPITHQREARKLELCASPSLRNLYPLFTGDLQRLSASHFCGKGRKPREGRFFPFISMARIDLELKAYRKPSTCAPETPLSLLSNDPPLYKRGSIAAIFQLSSELYSQHRAIGIAGGQFSIAKCL